MVAITVKFIAEVLPCRVSRITTIALRSHGDAGASHDFHQSPAANAQFHVGGVIFWCEGGTLSLCLSLIVREIYIHS